MEGIKGKIDCHHILHNREEWSLRNDALFLRETPSLIPALERSVHDEIHETCPPVPLLGCYALAIIRREFEPTPDTIETMENLMFAIEEAGRHPKAHPLEKDLGQLAIEAVRLQIPDIREGLILPRKCGYIK